MTPDVTTIHFVAYRRVSTQKQHDSQLGLLAQQDAIAQYIAKHHGTLLRDFVEVETGTSRKQRPIVQDALQFAKKHKATLVISKLDRLTRSVSFLSQLLDSGIDFVALDFPKADKTILQLMMVIAEFEADRIKERVNNALGQLKKQGVVLGKPENFTEEGRKEGREKINSLRKEKAQTFAYMTAPRLQLLRRQGKTLQQIADEMNTLQTPQPSGKIGAWTPTTVRNCLKTAHYL